MTILPAAPTTFMPMALALALGLLVGVQRGWATRGDVPGSRFAGVRTYGLIGLAGGISGVFRQSEPTLGVVVLATAAGLILLGYWRATRSTGPVSGTASIVALLTLACGYLAGSGQHAEAAATTGCIVLILSLRRPLHRLVRSLSEREVMAIGRFALIALVVLPLLPDAAMGPLEAWRPRSLWLVVVLVSGFSFAGYLAAKWLGPARGTLAMAATGSLVSSTAVTTAMAGRMHASAGANLYDSGEDTRLLNAAIALASAVMFVRVMVLTAVLAPFALPTLATGAVPGMAVSLIAAALLWRSSHPAPAASASTEPVALRNPFDLGPAVLMMALVMALTLAARWVLTHYGDRGLAVVLAITGTVDVDSAIITMGSLPADTLSARTAGLVLLPPILLNTLLKAGITLSLAGRRGWPAVLTLLASCGAALLPLALDPS